MANEGPSLSQAISTQIVKPSKVEWEFYGITIVATHNGVQLHLNGQVWLCFGDLDLFVDLLQQARAIAVEITDYESEE